MLRIKNMIYAENDKAFKEELIEFNKISTDTLFAYVLKNWDSNLGSTL